MDHENKRTEFLFHYNFQAFSQQDLYHVLRQRHFPTNYDLHQLELAIKNEGNTVNWLSLDSPSWKGDSPFWHRVYHYLSPLFCFDTFQFICKKFHSLLSTLHYTNAISKYSDLNPKYVKCIQNITTVLLDENVSKLTRVPDTVQYVIVSANHDIELNRRRLLRFPNLIGVAYQIGNFDPVSPGLVLKIAESFDPRVTSYPNLKILGSPTEPARSIDLIKCPNLIAVYFEYVLEEKVQPTFPSTLQYLWISTTSKDENFCPELWPSIQKLVSLFSLAVQRFMLNSMPIGLQLEYLDRLFIYSDKVSHSTLLNLSAFPNLTELATIKVEEFHKDYVGLHIEKWFILVSRCSRNNKFVDICKSIFHSLPNLRQVICSNIDNEFKEMLNQLFNGRVQFISDSPVQFIEDFPNFIPETNILTQTKWFHATKEYVRKKVSSKSIYSTEPQIYNKNKLVQRILTHHYFYRSQQRELFNILKDYKNRKDGFLMLTDALVVLIREFLALHDIPSFFSVNNRLFKDIRKLGVYDANIQWDITTSNVQHTLGCKHKIQKICVDNSNLIDFIKTLSSLKTLILSSSFLLKDYEIKDCNVVLHNSPMGKTSPERVIGFVDYHSPSIRNMVCPNAIVFSTLIGYSDDNLISQTFPNLRVLEIRSGLLCTKLDGLETKEIRDYLPKTLEFIHYFVEGRDHQAIILSAIVDLPNLRTFQLTNATAIGDYNARIGEFQLYGLTFPQIQTLILDCGSIRVLSLGAFPNLQHLVLDIMHHNTQFAIADKYPRLSTITLKGGCDCDGDTCHALGLLCFICANKCTIFHSEYMKHLIPKCRKDLTFCVYTANLRYWNGMNLGFSVPPA